MSSASSRPTSRAARATSVASSWRTSPVERRKKQQRPSKASPSRPIRSLTSARSTTITTISTTSSFRTPPAFYSHRRSTSSQRKRPSPPSSLPRQPRECTVSLRAPKTAWLKRPPSCLTRVMVEKTLHLPSPCLTATSQASSKSRSKRSRKSSK